MAFLLRDRPEIMSLFRGSLFLMSREQKTGRGGGRKWEGWKCSILNDVIYERSPSVL